MTMLRLGKSYTAAALTTSLQWVHDRTFFGFVYDTADPARRFVIELLVDGSPVKSIHAVDHVVGLAEQGVGDGRYGFTCSLSAQVLDHADVVEARIANLGVMIGEPVRLKQLSASGANCLDSGAVRWLGGLRFTGWIADGYEPNVEILVDDERVMRVRPERWSHIGDSENPRAVRGLDFHIPDRFADGSAHRLTAVHTNGERLDGSPLPFVAFANGFEQACRDLAPSVTSGLRESLLDRLVPMSVPFASYDRWRDGLLRPIASPRPLKAAIIGIGAGEMDDTLASLNAQSHLTWVAAALPCSGVGTAFDCAAARTLLAGEAAEAEFVVFLLSGAVLEPDAIMRISAAFQSCPDAVAVYTDFDLSGRDGSLWPVALPAFDYERMLEQGYCSYVFALRRAEAERILAAGASNIFRVFNSLLDEGQQAAARIVHLPGSIGSLPVIDRAAAGISLAEATRAHLTRRRIDAQVIPSRGEVFPAVRVARTPSSRDVTIVIPTRNRLELLTACIESLQPALQKRNCEIIVVDNDSDDPKTLDYLSSIDGGQTKVMRIAGEFNFSRLMNTAVSAANGEFVCLLNNDVQALDGDWLEEMLGRISEPDVGAVGAMLLWPSGVVQHGGVVLGPNFAATHAFTDRMTGDPGYGDLLRVAHQCSAVTAACMVTRRKDYLATGGMDELQFPVNFNDVDYCLKLRAMGRRIIFTPHARLRHFESASRGSDAQPDRKARLERELRNLRAKWSDVLMADPFYNPALSLDAIPFSALAWPVRSLECRVLQRPAPVDVPVGF